MLLECSTADVVTIERLGVRGTRAGAQFVDAPLTGGVEGAEAGTLTFMVGGTGAQVTRIRPVLEAMGERILHSGPFGSGSKMKLVTHMICATNLMVAAEARTRAQAGTRRAVNV
ncbi:NAD(P)-binding domain-containing protein [Caballeronia sp. INSB1]|uniref:NAD(P)-binding domain-containing protein n=1 Tax=unclassified Caballeronia TaxID=2646786 RepID=UPI0039047FF8